MMIGVETLVPDSDALGPPAPNRTPLHARVALGEGDSHEFLDPRELASPWGGTAADAPPCTIAKTKRRPQFREPPLEPS